MRCTLFGAGAGPLVGPPATATGSGPEGAGPGDAGMSSVQAGLAGTASALITGGGAGTSLRATGAVDIATGAAAMATGAASAAAIAAAGLAKSGAALGVTGALAVGARRDDWDSMAALFPNGFCGFVGLTGSLKGFWVGDVECAAFAAPRRSHGLPGCSGEGAR